MPFLLSYRSFLLRVVAHYLPTPQSFTGILRAFLPNACEKESFERSWDQLEYVTLSSSIVSK